MPTLIPIVSLKHTADNLYEYLVDQESEQCCCYEITFIYFVLCIYAVLMKISTVRITVNSYVSSRERAFKRLTG